MPGKAKLAQAALKDNAGACLPNGRRAKLADFMSVKRKVKLYFLHSFVSIQALAQHFSFAWVAQLARAFA
ncbi:MAG: hypothetical protein WD175_01745 [Candidatus Paceibacterota bacterium]